MQCPSCPAGIIHERPDDHRYDECGLKNVTLHGALLGQCKNCGESTIGIPAMSGLHTAIAKSLLLQPEYLQPEQLVFLHKHLNAAVSKRWSSLTQWRGYPLLTFDATKSLRHSSPAAEIELRFMFVRSLDMGLGEAFKLGRAIENIKYQAKTPSPISFSVKRSFLGMKRWVTDGH